MHDAPQHEEIPREPFPGALNANGSRPLYSRVVGLDGLDMPDAAGAPQTIRLIHSERAALRVIALDTYPKSVGRRGTQTHHALLAKWAGIDDDTFRDAVKSLKAKGLVRETKAGGLVLTPPPLHNGGPEWRAGQAHRAAALSLIPEGWMTNLERCMMFDAIAAADKDGIFAISQAQYARRVGIRKNHLTTHRKSLRGWKGWRPPIIQCQTFQRARTNPYVITLPAVDNLAGQELSMTMDEFVIEWAKTSLIAASDDILSGELNMLDAANAAPWLTGWTSPDTPNEAPPWTSPTPSPMTSPAPSPNRPAGLVQIHGTTSSTKPARQDSTDSWPDAVTAASTPLALAMLRLRLAPLGYDEPRKLIGTAQHIVSSVNVSALVKEHLRHDAQDIPSLEVAALSVMSSIVANIHEESRVNQIGSKEMLDEIHRRFDRLTGTGEMQ
ncbi:hypothetical protein [Brevibacterium senegalense]|uniref:hypothetical protein n=1 Tax=Brevibacterium senegalense TaxID=1033736 RepID=UPI0011CC8DDB|nr:hypothetical protein [Brevibacterium senegalense]